MDILNGLSNMFRASGTAVAEPTQTNTSKQQRPPEQVNPAPVASTASTISPEALAAPSLSNIGARVILLLAPVANKALQAAHVQGQDLNNASSILNFVSNPLLGQLKGQGNGWEGSKLQSYINTLVRQLSSIAKDVENHSELALDAVKSIGYIAQSLENPKAAQIAFNALLDLSDPSSQNLANSIKSQTRETENKKSATTLVTEFVNSKPIEAIKAILYLAQSHYNELGTTALANIVSAALKSSNNQNSQVQTAIMTNLGSYDVSSGDRYGNDIVGVLVHQSHTLASIQQGLAQSGVVDAKLTDHLTQLQQGLSTKIIEAKA